MVEIIGKGTRLYKTTGGRKIAIKNLIKSGHNYFVGFKDVNKIYPCGLSYGHAEWVGTKNDIHRVDC